MYECFQSTIPVLSDSALNTSCMFYQLCFEIYYINNDFLNVEIRHVAAKGKM